MEFWLWIMIRFFIKSHRQTESGYSLSRKVTNGFVPHAYSERERERERERESKPLTTF